MIRERCIERREVSDRCGVRRPERSGGQGNGWRCSDKADGGEKLEKRGLRDLEMPAAGGEEVREWPAWLNVQESV